MVTNPVAANQNATILEPTRRRGNVHLLHAADYIERDTDVVEGTFQHFDRLVYFRMYNGIVDLLKAVREHASRETELAA